MNSEKAPRSSSDEWEPAAHSLTDLRRMINSYTTGSEEMSEVAFEGQRPIVVRRTETKDMLLEVSATVKAGLSSGPSAGSVSDSLRTFFAGLEGPAATTEEVAEYLGCPQSDALEALTQLEHKGWLERKRSGETVLWWPSSSFPGKADEEEDDSVEVLPESVRKGLEKSERDIQEWIEENQEEGESLQETYDRIRGNPSFDEVKALLFGRDSANSPILDRIEKKRELDNERKDDLQNLFS